MQPDYQHGSAYHANRQKYSFAARMCLVSAFERLGDPASLLDVGCGSGELVMGCQAIGIDAVGVDLAVPDQAPAGLWRVDLRQPFDLDRRFDWVLCWEVAEHLPEASAATLCDSLVRHLSGPGGRLLFTAARPGQSGPGHVHCRPQAYWREQFTSRGLAYLSRESQALARRWKVLASDAPWYARNVQVFAWA